MNGWFRPFSRDNWHLVPHWRQIHHFMSAQALGVGSTILTVGIALGWSASALIFILVVTVAMVLAGTLIEQPEIRDE